MTANRSIIVGRTFARSTCLLLALGSGCVGETYIIAEADSEGESSGEGTTTSTPAMTSGTTMVAVGSVGVTTEMIPVAMGTTEAQPEESAESSSSSESTGESSSTGGSSSSGSSGDEADTIVMGGTGLRYSYYEGAWRSLPDFDALKPVSEGLTANFDIYAGGGSDGFGMVFDGSIMIPTTGSYSFFLRSDDGSRLYLDGELVVDHDGLHSSELVSFGMLRLEEGSLPIRVEYFDSGEQESLSVEWEGPDFGRGGIPDDALFHLD